MPENKKIILSAGGTGGHFFPAKALAVDLASRGYEVHFVTDKRGEKYQDQVKDIAQMHVTAAGTLGAGLLGKALGAMNIILGLIQSLFLLKKIKPLAIVGFGGYPSFPAVFVGQKLNIPTILHEQNAVVGKANKFLSKKAYRIALSLPKVIGLEEEDQMRAVITGNPVRQPLADLFTKAYKAPDEKSGFRIFVMGGSLGAHVFADVLPRAFKNIPENLRKGVELVQQCREEDIEATQKIYNEMGLNVKLAPFFDNVSEELETAHLVISRAGASTVAEITTAGRPAIFVPYPHHKDQQQKINAQTVAEKGGAWLMEEGKDFTPETLAQRLEIFMKAPQNLFQAAESSRNCSKPDAARKLGNLVTAVVEGWDKDDHTMHMIDDN